ncbi:XdhC family protein [Rhizobium sp. VS19-DR104.2]|nr:XdhC family protein [Rhizobium sp. VS19-DR96]MBZ5768235.1 XdhC family protein [Rhizobium sp. VS19-DR129.2]MBZ5775893.1 XdhC family protein [Rhizobium sp. VS19-DRK62.2]MBZ5787086.1 XdhC family protein [Rhizobium sp. VS19-DR121]MBZ5804160.1 XdhC family protein [Rhizobium sp. VS19-DR181]MBZ5820144.1 XdhC family protein [Rhizobium sp. VS19-DR183]MBZ5832652.1 XdhC family protein [Rhizobium sp. VS19-DR104.2]MBZ5843786.1 XdhC family protein [Rhizobium sp. VS19-DR104.1]
MQGFATVVDPVVPARAFMTDDAVEVLRFAADALESGHSVALATLVDIRGGSARPLGSHMAIRDDGLYCGFVSGGCTEAAVASEAVQAIENGCDRNLLLGEGSPFFDIVLPCGGGITIAIHVVRDSVPLRGILLEIGGRRHASLRYVPAQQTLSLGSVTEPTGWYGDGFITHYRPQVRVVLAGRSIEVAVAAKVAAAAGYDVRCYDGSTNVVEDLAIDQDTAVALLYHDIEFELPVLAKVLRSKPFYIGALGSTRTHARRTERLRELGYSQVDIARIKSPIGIFNKARDAHSLALSVLADVAGGRILIG